MEQTRVDQLDIMGIEMGWRAPERPKVEACGELIQRGDRLDGLRRADAGKDVEQGPRLDTFLAQMLGAVRAKPLRQLSLRCDQKRLVRELRRFCAERLEHLNLRGAVRHMIL